MTAITEIPVRAANGAETDLSAYAGQVLLIFNTASQCGFTPQLADLESLYREYRDRGFTVLAFPCNQFGQQEPGDADEIATFCSNTYDVTFPVFAKVDVNGDDAAPLFRHLKKEAPGLLGSQGIKWNFTKFLVDRSGKTVKRYAPKTSPREIAADIERLL